MQNISFIIHLWTVVIVLGVQFQFKYLQGGKIWKQKQLVIHYAHHWWKYRQFLVRWCFPEVMGTVHTLLMETSMVSGPSVFSRIDENYSTPMSVVARQKIRAASGWRFFLCFLVLIWLVRWSRHLVIYWGLLVNLMYWSCQRFTGKGLVVIREGINTPNAPYLR